jgi:hypothetical protein
MTPAIRAVTRAVGESLDLTSVKQIRSRLQTPRVVLARQIVLYVARAELGLSYPQLSRELRRHNTTCMHAVGKIATLIRQADPRTLDAVRAGEQAALEWRKLTPIASLRARQIRLRERAQEMLAESSRIGAELAKVGEAG